MTRARYLASITLIALLTAASLMAACADAVETTEEPYTSHDVEWDLTPSASDSKADGLVSKFDPAWLMSDAFFTNHDALTVEQLQAFFEATPYGDRSWLADALIDDKPAAQRIIEVAHEVTVNPLLLLARMQVEQSLISRAERPSQRKTDFAFGCGCPDYEACSVAFKGFGNQLRCAGQTLRRLYDDSASRVGGWRAGVGRKTLEGERVAPANHATAALYGYTPWILRGRGGNWLAWNVTDKFAQYFKERGALVGDDLEAAECLYRPGRAFIGDPCACAADCAFWTDERTQGVCHSAGFCTIPCMGGCPDLSGEAPTFCVQDRSAERAGGDISGGELSGVCMAKPSTFNSQCADLPLTQVETHTRFVGPSGSTGAQASVCAPAVSP